MAVQKQKPSKQRSRRRRSTYIALTRKRLINTVKLVRCRETWEYTLNHRVSPSWFYRWMEIIKRKEKIKKASTVIQA